MVGAYSGPTTTWPKPFAFEELLARVRARLRPGAGAAASLLRIGDLCLDLRTHQATASQRKANLSAQEFALLRALARHPGQTLSRQELLSMAWGVDFDPRTNLIDVYVGYLRRKLDQSVIETVRGTGYRLRINPPHSLARSGYSCLWPVSEKTLRAEGRACGR